VGRHSHAPEPGLRVKWRERANELDRRAVWVRDDPVVRCCPFPVHLWDHERDPVSEPEGRGLVDAHCAATDGGGYELAALLCPDREEAEVEIACRQCLGG